MHFELCEVKVGGRTLGRQKWSSKRNQGSKTKRQGEGE